VENRVADERHERPGGALIALAVILAITAAWWALALWPAGAMQPEWLARTRAACFGSARGGFPDAGGWILLIGEPLGMLGMLFSIWGRSLRSELRWVRRRPVRTFTLMSVATALLLVPVLLGIRTARVWVAMKRISIGPGAVAHRVNRPAPTIELVDQGGERISLARFRGQMVLLTFAYGHCATVCPSIVNDIHAARRTANRLDVPVVVLTLDPWRDTPERLPTLAKHWELRRDDRVLSGSVANVERVLDQLAIGRRRNETTGDIDHATAVMILDETGSIAWRVDGGASGIAGMLKR
jgi:protein SCO1/2